MRLKTLAVDLLKRSPALRLMIREILCRIKGLQYHHYARKIPVREKTVLFCSYHGKTVTCSPKAIYDRMRQDPDYQDWQFIWAAAQPQRYEELAAEPRTKVIPFGGRAFRQALAESQVWCFNITLPEEISPKPEQTYLQCWHGTPLKRLGYDITETGNAMNSIAEIRRKYRLEGEKVDYFLSPSPFASDCFRSAWQLERWGKGGAILETGYPRNDRLVRADREECRRVRQKLGIPEGKQVVLYTPTFRDDQHISGEGYAYRSQLDFDRLRDQLGEDYVILFRAHYLVASAFDFSAYPGFVLDVSGVEEINDLYLAADLMITDYSSTMFDYAVLRRPILFYMYDLEQYRDHLRGFYFDLRELPGEILTRDEQVAPGILAARQFRWDDRWESFRSRFAPLEDGHAAQRVIQTVMRKKEIHP